MESDVNIKKILWRCRRGTKELDLVLTEFVELNFRNLSAEEQDSFQALLEVEDPLLTRWLCLNETPQDHGMVKIVERILSSANP